MVDLVIERYGTLLKSGTVLVDAQDVGEEPRLLVALTQRIEDGHTPPRAVSQRFDFVEIGRDGTRRSAGPAPYLDYRRGHRRGDRRCSPACSKSLGLPTAWSGSPSAGRSSTA